MWCAAGSTVLKETYVFRRETVFLFLIAKIAKTKIICQNKRDFLCFQDFFKNFVCGAYPAASFVGVAKVAGKPYGLSSASEGVGLCGLGVPVGVL